MERETAELHQKLATIQEQTESKFAQQVTVMSQKLADKDREILRLRMQNTTMKKKVEERDRDIERLKSTRSFSPPPELPAEDESIDNEIRETWANVERQQRQETPPKATVSSINSYGGLKISVEPTKVIVESPRSATASPRFDMVKMSPDTSPFSPDLVRRTSTPPLMIKPNTPTKSESPQVEMAKVTYMHRAHTPTKLGDKLGPRPHTPTKVEIIKKPEGSVHHARSPSLDQLPRVDSQSRITFQIPKSPEPVKVVLSPKAAARSSSGPVSVEVYNKAGDTKEVKAAPGTPRIYGEGSQGGLDPKLPKEELSPKSLDSKPEFRPGTLRAEVSKPTIIFSPPTSPSPSPRPTPSPSPSPKPNPSKYTPAPRHSSNPHSPSPSPNPPPASPRSNSNPSPSTSPSPSFQTTTKPHIQYTSSSRNFSSSATPSPSPSPSPSQISPNPTPSPSPSSNSTSKDNHSKAAAILNFITRGRSNTLPNDVTGLPEANGAEHHGPPVSLMSPRGGMKIEVGTATETADEADEYLLPFFLSFPSVSFLFLSVPFFFLVH